MIIQLDWSQHVFLKKLGLKKKSPVFIVNLSRQTALHASVETGQFKVVQYLVEHNIDTTRKDIFGHTAMDLAQLLNRKEILELFERSRSRGNSENNVWIPSHNGVTTFMKSISTLYKLSSNTFWFFYILWKRFTPPRP